MAGGMGGVPITHGEIQAWQANTGHELNTWQAETLRRLSVEYAAEADAARSPSRLAPFAATVDSAGRAIVAATMRAQFGTLAKTNKGLK